VSPLAIRLFGPDGGPVSLGDVTATNSGIAIAVPALQHGTHVLSWRVVSADGHPVGGSVVFSIGAPSAHQPSGAPSLADPAVRAALWATKFAIYLAIAIGIGGAFCGAWVVPSCAIDDKSKRPSRARAASPADPFILTALLAGLGVTALSVGLQGLDALESPLRAIGRGAAWETGLATSYGLTAIVLAFALFAAVFSCAAPSATVSRVLAFVALVGAGIAMALSGHASNAEPRWINRPAVFAHGVSMAFWVGALLPLWFAVREGEQGNATLTRFSHGIPVPLALLAASGLWLASVQLGRIDALWTTAYGMVLIAKLIAVGALLGLAAANRYRLVPRFHGQEALAARRLRMSIGLEFAIAAGILALVAVWRFTPPPRSLAAADTISIHLHGAKAMAQIDIARDPAGRANAQIQVLDGTFQPLTVKELTLVLANRTAGLEPIRRAGVYFAAAGRWQIEDVQIPLAGRWEVQVEVLITDFEKTTVNDAVVLPRFP
jgi:copper transport protein